jgi:glutamine synthetase type III
VQTGPAEKYPTPTADVVFAQLSSDRAAIPVLGRSREVRTPRRINTSTNNISIAMSESDSVDEAMQRVRDTFESVVNETEEMSEQAKQSVEDAIDDLEQRIESLKEGE